MTTTAEKSGFSLVMGRRMSWRQVPILCAGAASLAWLVSSIWDNRGPDRPFGPYHISLVAEIAFGVLAVTSSIVVVANSLVTSKIRVQGATFGAAGTLIVASVVATCAWRIQTALGEGANIGAGFVISAAPFAVSALLFATVRIQKSSGGAAARYALVYILSCCTGPLLFTLVWTLPQPN